MESRSLTERQIKIMPLNPKRGEIWQVDLDPTVGSEMQKSRPCVVINADAFDQHFRQFGTVNVVP